MPRTAALVLVGTAGLVIGGIAMTQGSSDLGLGDVFAAARAWIWGDLAYRQTEEYTIITRLRLPRVLLAALVGGGLAIGGAALQGLLRNLLVSPYTLGISPAAAFGASLAILVFSDAAPGAVSVYTVAGALAASGAVALGVLFLSSSRRTSIATIVLFGVALSAIFGAMTALVQFVADEQTNARIVRWSFGTFNN
ncbi:MAG: iron ABC transporter permease, partial [Bifidobacteriaceae bacterium]|nr:iron ABC transporter permease [Bifidobacteriaceae bacterium]